MTDNKDHWVSRIRSRKAYQSVHGDAPPRDQRPSSAGMDWKVIAGAGVIVVVVIVGIVVAVRSIEPATGWLDLTRVRVATDEAYLYLLLETSGRSEPDWSVSGYRIAIDTYDENRGSRSLPAPLQASTGSGVEFLIELRGPGESSLLSVAGYDPFDGENPIYSGAAGTYEFRPLRVQTNRERFSRAGEYFPPVSVERGSLRFGSHDAASEAFDTRADVWVSDGAIEVRLPWSLLNVTDPSTRSVVHSLERGRGKIETIRTEGFRFYAYSFDLDSEAPRLVDQIPSGRGAAPLYRWETWERPNYELIPKRGTPLVRDAMVAIPDPPMQSEQEAEVTK